MINYSESSLLIRVNINDITKVPKRYVNLEDISRKQLDRACELLQNYVNTDESIQLAETIKKADVIPKLYQYAYVESMYQRLKDVSNLEQLAEKTKYHFDYSLDLVKTLNDVKALDAVKALLDKAHERQDEICDFNDSPLPQHKTGLCEFDEHYEDIFDRIELTDKEQKQFEKLNDKYGYTDACVKMDEILNPSNQHLTLVLDFGDDETKVSKDHGYYVCDSCLEYFNENSDGSISCDLEMVE